MTSKDAKASAARREWKSNDSEEAAWQQAVRWLARRERSASETKQYLTARGFAPDVAENVLGRLQQCGYVDDARLAAARAAYWHRRGYGRLRAAADLHARGVEGAKASRVLDEVFADEEQLARSVLAVRFSGVPSDARQRARAYRFLLNRGFPEGLVVVILGEAC
jgi:regulatory protein